MDMTEKMTDYEVQGWKEDSEHFLKQLEQNGSNTFGRSSSEHAEVIRDWQETLEKANRELERRNK